MAERAASASGRTLFLTRMAAIILAGTTLLCGFAAWANFQEHREDMSTLSDNQTKIGDLEDTVSDLKTRLADAQGDKSRAENALADQEDVAAREEAVTTAETSVADREAAVQAREDAMKARDAASTNWWAAEAQECLSRGGSYQMATITEGSLGSDVSCMTG